MNAILLGTPALLHMCLQAVIEVPYVEDLTWDTLLKFKGVVEDAAKGNTPVSSLAGKIPGLKIEKFSVPTDWFNKTPQEQYDSWSKGRQTGAGGLLPGQLNTSRLVGPQYTAGIPPILLLDPKGQPFGINKQPGDASLFGTRPTPVEQIPDYLAGQLVPAVSNTCPSVPVSYPPSLIAWIHKVRSQAHAGCSSPCPWVALSD